MEVSLGIAAGLGWGIALGLAVALLVALRQRAEADAPPPANLRQIQEDDERFPNFGTRRAA